MLFRDDFATLGDSGGSYLRTLVKAPADLSEVSTPPDPTKVDPNRSFSTLTPVRLTTVSPTPAPSPVPTTPTPITKGISPTTAPAILPAPTVPTPPVASPPPSGAIPTAPYVWINDPAPPPTYTVIGPVTSPAPSPLSPSPSPSPTYPGSNYPPAYPGVTPPGAVFGDVADQIMPGEVLTKDGKPAGAQGNGGKIALAILGALALFAGN